MEYIAAAPSATRWPSRGRPLTTVPGLALPDGEGGAIRTGGRTETFALDDVPLPTRSHVARGAGSTPA